MFVLQGSTSSPGLTNGLKRPGDELSGLPQRKIAATELMLGLNGSSSNGIAMLSRGISLSSGMSSSSSVDSKKPMSRGINLDNKSVPGKSFKLEHAYSKSSFDPSLP